MGLSEQERRIFSEIEERLAEEDPKLVERGRRATPEGRRGRRLKIAAAVFVLGFLLLLGIAQSIFFGLAGFALMFAGVVVGGRALQGVDGDLSQRVRSLLGRRGDDEDA